VKNLYAIAEEKTYLGIAMQNEEVLDLHPAPEEWFSPEHKPVVAAFHVLREKGSPVNPMAVLEQLRFTGEDLMLGSRRGAAYLFEIFQDADLGSASYCVKRIAEAAQRRTLLGSVNRIQQSLETSPDINDALDLTAKEIVNMQLSLDDPLEDTPIEGLYTLPEFLARPVKQAEWVIPFVLKRQERVVFLAPPGVGKSTLARQAAILTAVGKHPFFPTYEIPPQITLLVDLENPADIVSSKTRAQMDLLDKDAPDRNIHIWHQPGGIDIRSAKGARLLDRVMTKTKPAIMFIGPLYKLARKGRDDWETVALETAQVLDRLRVKHDCALWIEHHMPKATLGQVNKTPFGSSMWERWPEFGFVLNQPDTDKDVQYKLEGYRPGRDERDWPMALQRGSGFPWHALFNHTTEAKFRGLARQKNG
jgi:Replicative DNA helicase